MVDRRQWTAVAPLLLEMSGIPHPVDAAHLARKCRLTLVRRPGPGVELVGSELRYDATAAGEQRQRLIAEGIARWALRVCVVPESDLAVHTIMRGLLGGRAQLRRAVRS